MIYAIGERQRYAPKLTSPEPLYKVGKGLNSRGRPYPGGSVWRTVADAEAFIAADGVSETHMVLMVDANWESDTEQLPDEPFRRLLRACAANPGPDEQPPPPAGRDD